MSDVKVVSYLLTHNTALLVAVPSSKIISGLIPVGTTLPAIGISHISTMRRNAVKKGVTDFCTSRVQITVQAATYPLQKSILKLIREALPRTRATVNSVMVDDILIDIEGPDLRDDEAGIYQGSQDFKVTYNE